MSSRILIVEDEPIVADDLVRRIRRMGHDVIGVTDSGPEAISLSEALKPDLILMDIQLRGPMDGREAALQIQESTGAAVIYITAFVKAARLNAQPGQPVALYLVKPFSSAHLAEAISQALNSGAI